MASALAIALTASSGASAHVVQGESAPPLEAPAPDASDAAVPDGASIAPMVASGFDPTVARSHGFDVAFDRSGEPYLADSAAPSTAIGITSKDSLPLATVVNGNCGNSYIYLDSTGSRKYRVSTGFALVRPAVSYSWIANVGGYKHRFSGLLRFRYSWQGTATGMVAAAGFYTASASGTATLDNGIVCVSKTPIDSEVLY